MDSLRVSVIIPAYKAAGTIRRAVDSVLRQTYPATEIIVIDDGSPDDIAGSLNSYGSRITLIRQKNQGAAAARNAGIDCATGELIAFLDADDYWEPQKLERHAALYQKYSEIGLTASDYYTFDPETNERSRCRPTLPFDQVFNAAGHDSFETALKVWTGTVVIRRSLLASDRFVSGFEPAEDRHLWVRIIDRAPIYCLSDALAVAVLEPGSLSRSNVARDCGNMLRVVHEYRHLLGKRGTRKQEAVVLGRWAGRLLSEGQPRSALQPALRRLSIDPFKPRAWWALVKAGALSLSVRSDGRTRL
jgi:glycosyltransferase involved in cell wall biosynthesis